MAGQERDVIEVLEHDHQEVEQMFAELESLRGPSTHSFTDMTLFTDRGGALTP